MADIKWIKMATGLPGNRKIKQIRRLPDGDKIALMWVFMLCLAGDVNEQGLIYLTPEVPYTDEMLADEFDMDINVIRLGLEAFQRFGMIEIVDDIICLSSWEKWQAVDSMATIREQTRKRVAKHREKQKLIASNVTCNVTVTQCNATEEDIERDIEKELDNKDIIPDSDEPEPPAPKKPKKPKKPKEPEEPKREHGEYKHVLLTDTEYEKLAKDFGSDMRDKAIVFLDEYMEEKKKYKSQSHYLAIRRWVIDAVKEKEEKQNRGRKEPVPSWMNKGSFNNYDQRQYDASEMSDLERKMMQKTAGNSPEIAARAEALKKQLS